MYAGFVRKSKRIQVNQNMFIQNGALVIISGSKSKRNGLIQYKSTHFHYALTYVIITFAVLLFLNLYSSRMSQALFYNSKEVSMIERCLLAGNEISELDVVNSATVAEAVSRIDSLSASRLIVTDQYGIGIYDSVQQDSSTGKYALLPEIVQALEGFDVFSWNYKSGTMHSRAATPIYSYGTLIGCVICPSRMYSKVN